MKKLLTGIIIILAVFLIYLGFKDDDIYYLSIGDYLANGINPYGIKDYGYTDYVKDYLNENGKLKYYVEDIDNNKRMTDIINDIKENKKLNVNGKSKTYQNALIKADIITISIGINDLLGNVTFNTDFSVNDLYNKFDQVIKYYDEMFKLLRDYCKEKIILIGIYNITDNDELDQFFDYANNALAKLSSNYNIDYVNIYTEFKNLDYFPNSKTFYPNKLGYEIIADKIINLIEEKN